MASQKQFAVIIKHPGRDWEGDVRVDVVTVDENVTAEQVRQQVEREMLGPFEVLFVTEKLSPNRRIVIKEATATT